MQTAEAEPSELEALFTPPEAVAEPRRASLAVQLVVMVAAVSALCVVAVLVITVAAPVVTQVVATLLARLAPSSY